MERAAEIARLREAAGVVAATGAGRLVVVTGDPGEGKTRLCEELARSAAASELAVAWSRCATIGHHVPLWPWPDIVRELAHQQGRTLPELSSPRVRNRLSLYGAVADQLRELCLRRPGLVIIDDLHAAAKESVLLTRLVSGLLHRFPLLLVVTWRRDETDPDDPDDPDDPGGPLAALSRDAMVVDLRPFCEREVEEYLVRSGHCGTGSSQSVSRLLSQSGGNPMYLAELVHHQSAAAELDHDGMLRALTSRVRRLSRDQRRTLAACAVLGDDVPVEDVAAVLNAPASAVAAALRQTPLRSQTSDGRVQLSHELLRQACLSAVPDDERLQLHLAAAQQLSGTSVAEVVRRADHVVACASIAGVHKEAAVAACLEAAQTFLGALAFDSAAQWASTGTKLADTGIPACTRTELLLVEAEAASAAGRLADARACHGSAVVTATESDDPRLLARAALGLAGVWVEEQRSEVDRRRMIALCRRALERLPPGEPLLAARLAVRLAAEQADYTGDHAGLGAAVDAVRRLEDPAATAEALSLYHHVLLAPEYAEERLAVAEELLDNAVLADESIHSLFGLCWRTVDFYLLGDPGAERAFLDLSRTTSTLGNQAVGYIVAVMDVMRTFRRGELERAAQRAEEARALGEAAGDADALGYYCGQMVSLAWTRGELRGMAGAIRDVMDSATLRRADATFPALLAYVTALDGDHQTARSVLDGLLGDGLDAIPRLSTWTTAMAILIETAAVLGDVTLSDEVLSRFAPFGSRPLMSSLAVTCLGPGQRLLGLAHLTAGRLDDAVACFEDALVANGRLQNRPYDAIIRAQLAGALGRRGAAGDVVRARELYDNAITRGRSIGLSGRVTQWENEASRLMIASGERAPEVLRGRFLRERSSWHVQLGERSVVVEPFVGFLHIVQLLAQPDTDVAATDLMAPGRLRVAPTRGEPALDHAALSSYRSRLTELEVLMDRADAVGDEDAGRRAAEERDLVLARLRHDTGLGGRVRSLGDEGERSRIRVTKAIRRALTRLREVDAVIGDALERRISTGHFCRYATDSAQPIDWTVRIAPSAASAHRVVAG